MQALKQRFTHFSRGAKPIWRPPPSGAWVRRAGTVVSTPATNYRTMQPEEPGTDYSRGASTGGDSTRTRHGYS